MCPKILLDWKRGHLLHRKAKLFKNLCKSVTKIIFENRPTLNCWTSALTGAVKDPHTMMHLSFNDWLLATLTSPIPSHYKQARPSTAHLSLYLFQDLGTFSSCRHLRTTYLLFGQLFHSLPHPEGWSAPNISLNQKKTHLMAYRSYVEGYTDNLNVFLWMFNADDSLHTKPHFCLSFDE